MSAPSKRDLVEATSAAAGKAAAALLEGSGMLSREAQTPVPPDVASAPGTFRDDVERVLQSIPPDERASVHFHFKRRTSNGRGGTIMPNIGIFPAVGEDWQTTIPQEIAARYGEGEYIGFPKSSDGNAIKASPWVIRISEEFAKACNSSDPRALKPQTEDPVDTERKNQSLLKAKADTLQAQAALEEVQEAIKARRTERVAPPREQADGLAQRLDDMRRVMEAEKKVEMARADLDRAREMDGLRAEIANANRQPVAQPPSIDETIDKITSRFAPAVAGFSTLMQPLIAALAAKMMNPPAPPPQPDIAAILDKAFDRFQKLMQPSQPQTTKDRLEELNLLAQTAKALSPPVQKDGLLDRLEEYGHIKDLFGQDRESEPVVVQALRAAKEPIEALGKVVAQSGMLMNLQNRRAALVRASREKQAQGRANGQTGIAPATPGAVAPTTGTPSAKEWGDLCKYVSGCIDTKDNPETAAMTIAQKWPTAGAIVAQAGSPDTVLAGIGQIVDSLGGYAPLAMDLTAKIKSENGKPWTQELIAELAKLATGKGK
jgi:hypothetical protein